MNGRLKKGKRVVFSVLLFLPWLILLVIRGVAPLSLSYILGFLAIMTTFVSLAFLFTPRALGPPHVLSQQLWLYRRQSRKSPFVSDPRFL